MKNKLISTLISGVFFQVFFTACDRAPEVFSVNNFRSGFENNTKVNIVEQLPVKGVTGIWVGMEHRIRFSPSFASKRQNTSPKIIKDTSSFIVEFIDTIPEFSGCCDTTAYDFSFITIAGKPYIEMVSPGTKISAHDFMLPVSTYLKLNKLSHDTMILQMLDGQFMKGYLKSNGYNYFVPYDYLKEDITPIYITENPDKLAELLNAIYTVPEAFQRADTLVKKH